ncbi:hypothetical protein [Citricoccus nitrophenolicus]|uniref:hypothetical protein n=1 Tax=Citricoccus nitrophenolicus TaxID=863575 RepID=UPI0039B4E602
MISEPLELEGTEPCEAVDTEQDGQAAMNRFLNQAHIGDNLGLAGGVAAHALQKGWDSIVGAWVSSPQLGGGRGGGDRGAHLGGPGAPGR